MLHTSISQFELAIQEARKAFDHERSSFNQSVLGCAYAAAGRTEDAERILDHLVERTLNGPALPVWTALLEFGLNKQDEALSELEKALMVKDRDLLEFASYPWFKTYRMDPRWNRIEASLGLPKLQ